MNIVFTPRSLEDLRGISDYLLSKNPHATRRVLACIKSTIQNLEFFPEIGKKTEDINHKQLSVSRYPYAIYYRIVEDQIFITHIRHASRMPVDPTADL